MYRSNSHLWIQKSINSSLSYLPLLPRGLTIGHLKSNSTATIIKKPNDRFSHSCWTLIIPNLKTSLAFPVQWNCTGGRDSSKTAIISMQDSWLLQKNDILYFSVPLALILPLLIKTAILINNILMEKKTTILIFPISFAWLLIMTSKAKYLRFRREFYGDLRAQKLGVETARRPWRYHG